jgi:hypothetical protein
MSKTTQTSKIQDDNSCTVLALKSVTGWSEIKCHTILEKAGRVPNKGFDIVGYLSKCKGKIEDVKLKMVYRKKSWSDADYDSDKDYQNANTKITLKQFATKNPIGVYYVVTNTHALAIINGTIVDNLSGKSGGEGRGVKIAYKVTGNINPNIGKVTKADKAPKRHARLNYGEKVIYLGPQIKCQNKILAKKGDLITIETQQVSGLVVAKFYHYGKKVGNSYPKYWSATAKIDRTLLQTTKERECARIGEKINHIK